MYHQLAFLFYGKNVGFFSRILDLHDDKVTLIMLSALRTKFDTAYQPSCENKAQVWGWLI